MKKIFAGLSATALLALGCASTATAAPIHTQTAITECTHHSASALLSAADASWLATTVNCMHSDMLYQQTCGPQTLNGGCVMAGGRVAADLNLLAKRLLPKFINAHSGAQMNTVLAAEVHDLRIAECPGRYHLQFMADDSAGPQATSSTLKAAAAQLKSFVLTNANNAGFFGAAAAPGELATGGRGSRNAVSYVALSVTCE